jgi:hypothetical protein
MLNGGAVATKNRPPVLMLPKSALLVNVEGPAC